MKRWTLPLFFILLSSVSFSQSAANKSAELHAQITDLTNRDARANFKRDLKKLLEDYPSDTKADSQKASQVRKKYPARAADIKLEK